MDVWALNLPQFYETKENNEWWGKGFTEWTNVKKAKPIFSGHEQPMEPLNDFYYDLSKIETIKWQAELAKKYSVSGFVYYHYWYSGRHLLEKPCELLRDSPEIDIKYCFCWANHPWTRAWNGKNQDVMVQQIYGMEDEWEEHLQYLLSFFKDNRYLKISNKPVLFIYNTHDLENADKRIEYWNRRLQQEGFAGIYIVEYISTFNPQPSIKSSQAVYEDEPNFTCRFEISNFNKAKRVLCKTLKLTDYQDYDSLYKLILKKRATYDGRKIVLGCFPSWDNSARKGKNSRIITGANPKKFKLYLEKLKNIKRTDSMDMLLINAWNEWGEGTTLEPTKRYGYGYLEAIKDVFANK